jgi:hypothetical protein
MNTLLERFNEASQVLSVHNEGKHQSIFYRGFKIQKNNATNEVTIYKLYKNHHKVDENSELCKWFKTFSFKYVCDMLMVRRNFNKLYTTDRRYMNSKSVDSEHLLLKADILERLRSCISNLTYSVNHGA